MQYKVEHEFRKNFFPEPEVARLYIESAFVTLSNNRKLRSVRQTWPVKIMQFKVEHEVKKNCFLEPEVARLYIESAFVNSSNNQKLKCSIYSTKHKSTKCGKIVLSLRAPKFWHHFVSKAKLEEHVKIQQHHFESLSFSILIFCFFLHWFWQVGTFQNERRKKNLTPIFKFLTNEQRTTKMSSSSSTT